MSRPMLWRTRRVWRRAIREVRPARPNPWPKCRGCFHRNDPDAICRLCRRCPGCCTTCTRCARCARACPGHREETR